MYICYMADVTYSGVSTPRRPRSTSDRVSGVQAGVRMPTVSSMGRVHLVLGVDGQLACGSLALWPVRRMRWRSPSELTCPVCRHVLEEGRRAK